MILSIVRRTVPVLAALALAGCSESSTGPSETLNLGFEDVTNGRPDGWGYVGGAGYSLFSDTEVVHGGEHSLRLQYLGNDTFGTSGRALPVEAARGKTVRYSGWIRTASVAVTDGAQNPWAGLWMRVDGATTTLAIDNMHDQGPSGTTDWQRFEIVLDVPQEATAIYIGTLLAGSGRAWFDDLEIHIDGQPYR
ncbi:hypothetical protein [Longimicrobium sp.]|uniref:hypothetical protein n=1 Tax=Longimicrobium sp. TaxID=2029185 RepID=UPI003B3A355D